MTGDRKLIDRVRPHLLAAPPYASVQTPEEWSRRLGVPVERIIKLDANENPYGPSPRALEALAACNSYHIYPDPEQRRLREALGAYIGYDPSWLVAGSGSDELIDLLVRLFVAPGEAIVNFPPTFGMYPFLADVLGARVLNVQRRDDFTLDLPAAVKAASQAQLIFAVSPNNPSATLLSRAELDALLATGKPVAVDEAYAEFSGETFVPLVRQHANLIVLRTLSKWAGLAGLRLGFMVADPALIDITLRIKQPYNVNVAAEAAALASLEDLEYLQTKINAIVRERERLEASLRALTGVEVTPSSSNFVLCRLVDADAGLARERLAEQGILVRYFDTPLLRNHLRISAGRPSDTDAVVRALRDIVTSGAAVRSKS
jgi:histidinol-phosphate aminotransferase